MGRLPLGNALQGCIAPPRITSSERLWPRKKTSIDGVSASQRLRRRLRTQKNGIEFLYRKDHRRRTYRNKVRHQQLTQAVERYCRKSRPSSCKLKVGLAVYYGIHIGRDGVELGMGKIHQISYCNRRGYPRWEETIVDLQSSNGAMIAAFGSHCVPRHCSAFSGQWLDSFRFGCLG